MNGAVDYDAPREDRLGGGGTKVITRDEGEAVLLRGLFDAQGQPVECLITYVRRSGRRGVLGFRAPQAVQICRLEPKRC